MNTTDLNRSFSASVGTNLRGSASNSLVSYLDMWPAESPFFIVATVLYSFIFLGGFVGNTFIISTILRSKEMRTPCNLLIMNIAIADLAVAVIAAPLRILEIYYHWPFGDFMCRFLAPLQDVFVCVSVVTHTTIALERYRAIVKPMMTKISVSITRAVICVTWFSCYFASALPIAVISRTEQHDGEIFCAISFPSTTFRRVYEIYLVVVFIALPISVQIWAYTCMSRVVSADIFHHFRIRSSELKNAANTKRLSHDATGLRRRETKTSFDLARNRRRNSLVKMVIILVVVFQICYIPRGILMMMREFGDFSETAAFMYIDMAALILYYMKHVLNPLIIFTSSSDFRTRMRNSFQAFTHLTV